MAVWLSGRTITAQSPSGANEEYAIVAVVSTQHLIDER